jgi:class 3 adenylate cyclase/tetratricopeptide (TPR) repeat protein
VQICPSCGEENPAKFRLCGFCGTPLAPELPPQEVRKTVTIVFSDLKGSTAMGEKLDSEAVREVMSRYFDEMKAALERHGGTVEKYIGDAIMAVFGLPRVHEDDALRAVRAAAEMREHLAALNVELEERWGVTVGNRTGVNTGEVVAGDPTTGQRLVTGDTVNTAARLEQAAPTSEVLLGDTTYRLVRHAVEVEEVEPLELKGKAERVPAYRLVEVHEAESVERRRDSPLVGRERELGLLSDELAAATRDRGSRRVTIVAQAGVGKSRLIDEFGRSAAASEARMLRGRCLPYGRGITFWPLVEIVRDAATIEDEDSPETARAKLREAAGPETDDVAARVASAVGLGGEDFSLDEIFWGTRKFFEHLASQQPLVVLFEDIHWAESAFLDLIEYVLKNASDVPLLLVCATRPDLFEHRADWADRGAMIELEPLTEEQSALVVQHLLGDAPIPDDARARIVSAAEGNPLFVEQLLSMLIDDGLLEREGDAWVPAGDLSELSIPGTIQALLAARLDLLSPEERAVIEPASVIGQIFEQPAVEELAPEPVRPAVPEYLGSMTQKQLVRPVQADGEHEYRFHHILVRDAAYQGILKRARATFHARFADWAERVNRERDRGTEFEEILGYHLEQAHQYLSELGPLDDHGLELGRRGAAKLGPAGRRAFARGDMAAAANLLRRAVNLLPERDRSRVELLPDLAEVMTEIGEFAWGEVFLEEAMEAAQATGDSTLEAHVTLGRLLIQRFGDDAAWGDQVVAVTGDVIKVLEGVEDYAGLAKAYRLLCLVHGTASQWAAFLAAGDRDLHYATLAGDRRAQMRAVTARAIAANYGPEPVEPAIAHCEEALELAAGNRRSEGLVMSYLAELEALHGNFDRARELCRASREILLDAGAEIQAHGTASRAGPVELLAGDPAGAVERLRLDYEALSELNEIYFASTLAALLAEALYVEGNYDEAETFTRKAEELAPEDDTWTQAAWRSIRAKLIAIGNGNGRDEAVDLARQGVELLQTTDAPVWRANALSDYATVLEAYGQTDEARACFEEALSLYESKAASVPAERARMRLNQIGSGVVVAGASTPRAR